MKFNSEIAPTAQRQAINSVTNAQLSGEQCRVFNVNVALLASGSMVAVSDRYCSMHAFNIDKHAVSAKEAGAYLIDDGVHSMHVTMSDAHLEFYGRRRMLSNTLQACGQWCLSLHHRRGSPGAILFLDTIGQARNSRIDQ